MAHGASEAGVHPAIGRHRRLDLRPLRDDGPAQRRRRRREHGPGHPGQRHGGHDRQPAVLLHGRAACSRSSAASAFARPPPGHHPAAQFHENNVRSSGRRSPTPASRWSWPSGSVWKRPRRRTSRRRPVSDTRKQDIILAGVGGQGILSIAFVIDSAALKEGLHVKQAEVHGMAQRGGAVKSHLRLSSRPDLERPYPPGRGRPDPERRAAGSLAVSRFPQARGPHRHEQRPPSSTSPTTRIRMPCWAGSRPFRAAWSWPAMPWPRRPARAGPRTRSCSAPPRRSCCRARRPCSKFVRVLFEKRGDKILEANLKAFELGAGRAAE